MKVPFAVHRSPFIVPRFFFILHPSSFVFFFCVVVCTFSCHKDHSGDRLLVISPHPETILYEFQWAFEPWYRQRTGRDIEVIWLDQGGSTKMQRFLFNEFQRSPNGADIDMIWGGGMDPYYNLAARDLLEPYRLPEPLLRAIPKDYHGIPLYDPRYRWYGTALTGFGIIYNRKVLKLEGLPTPQTWTDLTAPAFSSWVGAADPRQSGSAYMMLEIMLQAYGWEKGWEIITLMAANTNAFTRLASDVPRDVALGEIAAGFCIDNYAYTQMALTGRDVLGYVMPEGLTVINPDGIAILKGAPNLAAARLFIEFVMSDPGQRLLMTPIGQPGGPLQFNLSRMSVLPELYDRLGEQSLVPINPFRLKPALSFNAQKSSERQKLVNDLIGVLLIENHGALKEAWRAVADCPPDQRLALSQRLARMPVTEEEGLILARQAGNDPVARNKALVEWSEFARTKYGEVFQDAEGLQSATPAVGEHTASPRR